MKFSFIYSSRNWSFWSISLAYKFSNGLPFFLIFFVRRNRRSRCGRHEGQIRKFANSANPPGIVGFALKYRCVFFFAFFPGLNVKFHHLPFFFCWKKCHFCPISEIESVFLSSILSFPGGRKYISLSMCCCEVYETFFSSDKGLARQVIKLRVLFSHFMQPLKKRLWAQGRPDDHFDHHAKYTLRTIVLALATKWVFYSSSTSLIKENCPAVMYELRYKGYPKAWWATPLKTGFKVFGLPEGEWRELRLWFRVHRRV